MMWNLYPLSRSDCASGEGKQEAEGIHLRNRSSGCMILCHGHDGSTIDGTNLKKERG
jgi:hypothetical protein